MKGEKNIVADALSISTLNVNQETTQKSTYQQKILSEINDNKETTEGNLSINLYLIQKYQRAKPSMIDKYTNGTYHKGYFCGGINIDLKLITC